MKTAKRLLFCTVLIAVLLLSACGTEKPVSDAASVRSFSFIAKDIDRNELYNGTVETEKIYVGEALIDEDLIKGEDGPYGLYIKEVCGVTADYEKDGTYWAFYVDGAYSSSGVDQTEITEGAQYSLEVEK